MSDHKLLWCTMHRKSFTPFKCRLGCPTGDYVPGNNCGYAKEGDKMNFTDLSLRLSRDEDYNLRVMQTVYAAWEAEREIIVFSKYKDHLRYLEKEAHALGIPEAHTSLYFGGMDKDDCLQPKITFATYGVAKHGLDVPWKDCAILALPVTEVEQIAGRVERTMAGKRQPVIIDIVVPSVRFWSNQQKARLKFYRSAGYGISACSIAGARDALHHGLET
jgi:hypothetical protein